jgi:transposase-like protein
MVTPICHRRPQRAQLTALLQDHYQHRRRDVRVRSGPTTDEQGENRELRRRVRLLEAENEVLRRAAAYLSQAQLPGTRSSATLPMTGSPSR